ncbi:sodium channel modifier 1 isoform X1 [Harpia harpyja]|uniref:sodium channel modifier 1 isoform X1 n=1 Tax=Harpia harpyja TaxID=202280 RepID=UPI0022B210C6|nr:sodium channel modifier 1 isoform X1 [Harpia harpyja]
MSFKREGDDPGQLGVLQKRRIADLLANYIPEDEALLLRSGRYACTVCAHRPVFDTLDVLTVHRAGKKHMGSLQRFYGRKRSLQDVAQKRQHEEEVQAEEAGVQGSPAPLLARTRRIAQNALLKAAPYSSCCRRTGVEGSSSQAQTGLSATPTLPLQKDGEAVDASPAALLLGHCGGRADTPKAAPAQTQRGSKGKASLSARSRPEALSPERRQALERYLQLRSAGWIQDCSGKWVKDENAEFDSDEDEPPVLLPA